MCFFFFFLCCCPGEVHARIETLAVVWKHCLSRHIVLIASSAAHSKYSVQQNNINDNASSHVQLRYLNELCGIIIRLMPVHGRLGEEVK